MRQFAGFGTPEETNERYKELLAAGGTGLSVAFDLPTLMGRDPDHPLSLGEVGKCGVNVTSLADMERLFDGIALGDITTSMTINSPAPMIFAMYLVVAEQQGADWATLSGTIQNDILKEFIAQKEYIFPPRPSMRLITDIFAFCAERGAAVEHHLGERLPHPRSRRDRAAGAGVHAARRHRVRAVRRRRRARRRRLRAAHLVLLQLAQRLLRGDRQVPRRPQALGRGDARPLRREEPALVAAALPHADRRRVADRAAAVQQRRPHRAAGAGGGARRHQLAAHQLARRGAGAADRGGGDARAAHAADHRPRERRHQRRRSARRLVLRREADARHGRGHADATATRSTAWAAWSRRSSSGYPQREIAEASYQFQQAVERSEKVIVGVNDFVQEDEPPIEILYIDDTRRRDAAGPARASCRRDRDNGARRRGRSTRCETAARGSGNTMPPLLDCVRAYATVGEMCDALRDVWGEYEEVPVI